MEAEERDAQGILSLEPYKSMINLRISKPFLSLPSHRFSLLAISDRFGWVIAASNPDEDKSSGSGFILASKEELENILEEAEETVEFDYLKAAAFIPTSSFSANDSSTITHLSFAAYDQIIIVAISDGSVHLFLLQDIVANKSLKPLKCIQKPVKNSLSILSANPSKGGEISGVVTLVYSDGTAKMIDCYNDQTYWTASSVTAADWSPMGKRLCVGYCDGSLEYIDLGGVSKGKILPPPQVREQGLLVLHIKWFSQKDFLITFSTPVGQDSLVYHEIYSLHLTRLTASPDHTFSRIVDINPSDGDLDLPPNVLAGTLKMIPEAGLKTLFLISCTNCSELTAIGYGPDDKPVRLILDEDQRPTLPSSEEDFSSTSPLGFVASHSPKLGTPLIWCITNDGVLAFWKVKLLAEAMGSVTDVWDGALNKIEDILKVPEAGTLAPLPSQDLISTKSSSAADQSHEKVVIGTSNSSTVTKFDSVAPVVNAFGSITSFESTKLASSLAPAFSTTTALASSLPSKPASSQVPSAFGVSSFGQTSLAGKPESTSKSAALGFGISSFGTTAFNTPGFGVSPFGSKLESTSTSNPSTTQTGFSSFATVGNDSSLNNSGYSIGGFAQFSSGENSSFLDVAPDAASTSIFDQPDDRQSSSTESPDTSGLIAKYSFSSSSFVNSVKGGAQSFRSTFPQDGPVESVLSSKYQTENTPSSSLIQSNNFEDGQSDKTPSPPLNPQSATELHNIKLPVTLGSHFAFDLSLEPLASKKSDDSLTNEKHTKGDSEVSTLPPSSAPITSCIAFGSSRVDLLTPQTEKFPQGKEEYQNSTSQLAQINEKAPSPSPPDGNPILKVSTIQLKPTDERQKTPENLKTYPQETNASPDESGSDLDLEKYLDSELDEISSQGSDVSGELSEELERQNRGPRSRTDNQSDVSLSKSDLASTNDSRPSVEITKSLAKEKLVNECREVEALTPVKGGHQNGNPGSGSNKKPEASLTKLDQGTTLSAVLKPSPEEESKEVEALILEKADEDSKVKEKDFAHVKGPGFEGKSQTTVEPSLQKGFLDSKAKSYFGLASSPPKSKRCDVSVFEKKSSAALTNNYKALEQKPLEPLKSAYLILDQKELVSESVLDSKLSPEHKPSAPQPKIHTRNTSKSITSDSPGAPSNQTVDSVESNPVKKESVDTRNPTFFTKPDTPPIQASPLTPSAVPKIYANPVVDSFLISHSGFDQALLSIVDLTDCELKDLDSVCSTCRVFISKAKEMVPYDAAKLENLQINDWQMGDLPSFCAEIKHMQNLAIQRREEVEAHLACVTALENAILKADLKKDEIKRVLRLQRDPGYSKVMSTRQLGPVQRNYQKDARRLMRDVKQGIYQITEALQSFKTKISGANTRKPQIRSPSLDTINRCIRNITLVMTEYIIYLERLNLRLRKAKILMKERDQTKSTGLEVSMMTKPMIGNSESLAALRTSRSSGLKSSMLSESCIRKRNSPILTKAKLLSEIPRGERSGVSHILSMETLEIRPRANSSG